MDPNSEIHNNQTALEENAHIPGNINEVIFIEDHKADQFLLELLLAESFPQLKLRFLLDGEKAEEFLFNSPQHSISSSSRKRILIILDLKLPRISGLDLLRKLQQHPRRADMIILVSTNSDSKKDIRLAYEYGINAYIKKSLDIDEYQQGLQKAIHFLLNIPFD